MNPLFFIALIGIGIVAVTGAKVSNTVARSSIKFMGVDSVTIDGGEIIITSSVAIDNPTNNTLTVKQPFIKLNYNGSEVATSKASSKMYSVKANDRTKMKLDLRVPFGNLPALAAAILNKSKDGKKIILETSTVINGLSVKDSQDFTIGQLVGLLKNE
jgi:LEA14-like dessication related protein